MAQLSCRVTHSKCSYKNDVVFAERYAFSKSNTVTELFGENDVNPTYFYRNLFCPGYTGLFSLWVYFPCVASPHIFIGTPFAPKPALYLHSLA